LELAAIYGHIDVFELKQIKLDPTHKRASDILRCCCFRDNSKLLKILLEKGFNPKQMENKGSSLIQSIISSMDREYNPYTYRKEKKDIDTWSAREKIKMIHMLVRYGAKWLPKDDRDINYIRRSLLKMKDDYVMEFVWIMSEYQTCTRASIEMLLKTPKIRSLVSQHAGRLNELMAAFNS